MSGTPPPRVAAPGKRISIVLAVAVHLVLAGFLVYGIHWQTKVRDVVEVELVRQQPASQPVVEPKPEPKEEPKPEPKPVIKQEPKPSPPPKPDIVIKEKPKPKEEPKPKLDFQRLLAEDENRIRTERQLADDERQRRQQAEAQAAAARSKAQATYSDRIRDKIRGNIVLPPELKGNPTAIFEVVQLPSGEVISTRLVKSSGHSGYDAAVERAILKASPLPKPDDPSLFERSLKLTFCPQEDGKCG